MSQQEPQSLHDDRSQTDQSLECERGKTDEGLFSLRKKTEHKTDAKVKSDRSEADMARAQSRDDHDSQFRAENNLSEQRIEEDDTIKNERLKMDAALKAERKQKEAVLYNFLHKERSETDDHLSQERERTDLAASVSSKLLSDEVQLHTQTKAQLTTRAELMAMVSHDLRSPLSAVFSCADMLLEDRARSGMTDETKYWIEFMKRNAATALRLISDILDSERFAQGKLQIRCKEENLREIIEHASEQHVLTAAAKGIMLRAMPPPEELTVFCDRDRIEQVVSNLIGNALKFTPEGGAVVVKSEVATESYKVSVSDSGKGITELDQTRIFDRYTQIDKKDSRGVGLGLYISKALIESHGGELWVESTSGQGSTFIFTLPKQL